MPPKMKKRDSYLLDERSIGPQLAELIVSSLEDQGVKRSHTLQKTDLDPEIFGQEHPVTFRQMIQLIENAMDLSPTPWIGLKIGAAESISTWGILGYAMMSCATEIDAFRLGMQFQETGPSLMLLNGTEDQGLLRIELKSIVPLGRTLPFCVEENFAGICAVSAFYMRRRLAPVKIYLSYAPPSYAEKYEEVFECPVHFNQSSNTLWVPLPDKTPLTYSDPVTANVCKKIVESMVQSSSSDGDFIRDVQKTLLHRPGYFPDMEEVASSLAISSRTLRRKLKEKGTSFSDILVGVRMNLAMDYLRHSSVSVEQIADFAGYTEPTNFVRAFKKWCGRPPSHFRRQETTPRLRES